MTDTFDVVAGGKTTHYTSAKEAGAAFFEADSASRPSVIHAMPAGPSTPPGGSARIMARTEIHGLYENGDTRYVKSLPGSESRTDKDFRAGYTEAMLRQREDEQRAAKTPMRPG